MIRGIRTLRASRLVEIFRSGITNRFQTVRPLPTLRFAILLSLSLALAINIGTVLAADTTNSSMQDSGASFGSNRLAQTGITVTELEAREENPIVNLEELPRAVVRIEAFGEFVDPSDGQRASVAGRGSGFIIDPSGIAVTNNHVVTGADSLQITLPGQEAPLSAEILGVSECADLALIDIEGDGYPYLSLSENEPSSGADIYAAGYPLGEDEMALVEGTISVVGSSIQSNWASVDGVIQHNAAINPGFSGGPIVNEEGEVYGITYAGNPGSVQYFAISQLAARPLIERLALGQNVDAIGVNAQVVNFVDDSYGIWVTSVEAESPAAQLGLQGGDIIVSLNDVSLTADRTIGTYCNIVRNGGSDSQLPIQVLRFATEELLEGTLNNRSLISRFSFANELDRSNLSPNDGAASDANAATLSSDAEALSANQEQLTDNQLTPAQNPPAQNPPGQTEYSDFRPVSDDSNTITIELPTDWVDISNGDWIEDGEKVGVYISGAPDLDAHFGAWYSTWDTPGVFFGFSQVLAQDGGADRWLDNIDLSSDCTYEGRSQLPQGFFTGFYDVWGSCGNTESIVLVVGAMPQSQDYLFIIETLSVTRADLLAVDHILDTFVINLPDLSREDDLAALVKSQIDTNGMLYPYELATSDAINALLPADWTDMNSSEWVIDDEVVGPSLVIAPDAAGFQNGWEIPGAWSRTSSELPEDLDPDVVLDSLQFRESCTYDSRYTHEHTMFGVRYESKYDLWTNCGDVDSILAVVFASAPAQGTHTLVEFQAVSDADAEAFGVFLNSFFIVDENLQTGTPAAELDGETELSSADEGSPDAAVAETTELSEATAPPVLDEETTDSEPDGDSETDDAVGVSGNDDAANDNEDTAEVVYVQIDDDTGTLSLEIPNSWTEIASGDWVVDGENYGLSLTASTDLAAYDEGWSTPGVFMGVSDALAALDTDAFLEFFNFNEECTYGERFAYSTDRFVGSYDVWENCGGVPGVYTVLAVKSVGASSPLIMLNVLSTDRAEVDLFESVLSNFDYSGPTIAEADAGAPETSATEGSATEGSATAGSTTEGVTDDGLDDIEVVEVDDSQTGASETIVSRVVVNALNVRSGPGVDNPRIDSVFTGELLTTIGQVNNCRWLRVVTPSGEVGWVSGSAEFVSIGGNCSDLAEVDNPSQQSNTTASTDNQSADTGSGESTAPASNAANEESISELQAANNAQRGCFLFQNELNAEVTVTITRQDAVWNDTFLMQPEEETEYCFDPGSYTYSLDAPPPWGSTNGELDVDEGDRYFFPIRSE